MKPIVIAVLVGLLIPTLWGFIAPRGQWRVLTGWSRRDPYVDGPGPVALSLHRLVAGAALIAVVAVGISLYTVPQSTLANPAVRVSPPPKAPLWGSPEPVVVNRVFTPMSAPAGGLVVEPILGYQAVEGSSRDPSYLFDLKYFTHPGTADGDGFIGANPPAGLSALDMADIVVQVRGDKRCIPYQVAVAETDTTISIGVYYGQPGSPDDPNIAHLTDCATDGGKSGTTSTLIPIQLSNSVLGRTVLGFDGSPITPVGGATTK